MKGLIEMLELRFHKAKNFKMGKISFFILLGPPRKKSFPGTHCWKDYSEKKNDQPTSQIQIMKILC